MRYREKHQEEIKTPRRQYREVKTVCSCGMEIVKNNIARHLQTKKHTAGGATKSRRNESKRNDLKR